MKRLDFIKNTTLLCTLLFALLLTACGGSKSPANLLVGTWLRDSDTRIDYTFEKDGSCDAVFSYTETIRAEADQYMIEKDGTLVLQNTLAPAEAVFEKADTEEEALEDTSTYFVSSDTLVIEGETYTRSE